MRKILFVEDDVLIARIYRRKLEEADFKVVVAEDGLVAMKMISESQPDLIVLDIMLPRMNGLDVLKYLRQHPGLKSTPVIVFSNAFLNELWDQIAALGVQEMLLKSSVSPPQLVETVARILKHPLPAARLPARGATPAAPPPKTEPARATRPAAPPAPAAIPNPARESATEFGLRMRHDFFGRIPDIAQGLQQACSDFLAGVDAPTQLRRLEDLRRKIGFLTHMTSMAGCYRLAQLASAFEALLFELQLKPQSLNHSSRHTISSTVALMADCLSRADRADEQCLSPTEVLVVDDDVVSSRALVVTLERADIKATSVQDPFVALEKLKQHNYDLALIDINLPGISGFSVCEQLRQMPRHAKTPVIFITLYSEFEPRARSILNQGDDLISKPIMAIELSVKVIAHILRCRVPDVALAN
jgi:CheY-like chemotaxis protein